MEPADDRELSALLRAWQAPDAPPGLGARLRVARTPWWRWLLTGTIRIPVPVAIAVVLLVAGWLYLRTPGLPAAPPPAPVVSLADFEPVAAVDVRVVGEVK